MKKPVTFDPAVHTIGVSHKFIASRMAERPDPPEPVNGAIFGIASMSENSPHGGEMHADGDEVLYLISGHVRVVLLDSEDKMDMHPGDGLVVPKGTWHRVDILQPSQIMYLTPGPNNKYRPLDSNK